MRKISSKTNFGIIGKTKQIIDTPSCYRNIGPLIENEKKFVCTIPSFEESNFEDFSNINVQVQRSPS